VEFSQIQSESIRPPSRDAPDEVGSRWYDGTRVGAQGSGEDWLATFWSQDEE